METITKPSALKKGGHRNIQFENLAFPLMDMLYNTALKMTRDQLDAEDLVQETYLKAYRFFHRFQPGTNIRAWMFRILVNNFINQYRHRQKQPLTVNFDTTPALQLGSSSRQPAKEVAVDFLENYNDVFDDVVSRALDRLPDEYRLVVLLADVNDLKYEEIAQALGIPIGTVMSRLNRGRKKLAEFLKRYAVENGFIKIN